jgi:hypothetical protein
MRATGASRSGGSAKAAATGALAALLMGAIGCAGTSDTSERKSGSQAADASRPAHVEALGGDAGLAAIDATAGGFLYGKQAEAGRDAYERGRAEGRLERRPPPPPPH